MALNHSLLQEHFINKFQDIFLIHPFQKIRLNCTDWLLESRHSPFIPSNPSFLQKFAIYFESISSLASASLVANIIDHGENPWTHRNYVRMGFQLQSPSNSSYISRVCTHTVFTYDDAYRTIGISLSQRSISINQCY